MKRLLSFLFCLFLVACSHRELPRVGEKFNASGYSGVGIAEETELYVKYRLYTDTFMGAADGFACYVTVDKNGTIIAVWNGRAYPK